jgi:hypothetical protein
VPKQDQHSRDLRKLYKKYNPDSQDHRTDCAANNYAWLHVENILQIVEAARNALKGKQLREFCAKKSLEKLCRVTSKPESFIQALNEALFAARPIFVPVHQGDEVMYRNHKLMVTATKDDGAFVQLGDHVQGESHFEGHDMEQWIARHEIDTKLHKRPRAMKGNESDIMDAVVEDAYKRAVECLKTNPSQYVQSGIGSTACSPAEPVIFYSCVGVCFVHAYGRDWQYSAAQAHEVARTGTPRRTTCPLPPGQRQPLQPCGHSGAALSKASGALLLTRRAHNCGAHKGRASS